MSKSVPPPRSGRGRKPAGCHPEAWAAFKADWLRPERPPAEASMRVALRVAESNGWSPVPEYANYYRRRIRRELSPQAIALARRGPEAVDRMSPAQVRDRGALASMEAVCADGHRWDVRVKWPDGTIARPLMVAWQDIRSGKLLGWRIGSDETSDLYRLSCADMLWKHGRPGAAIVDNGRGIASKCMTGGTPNRYRGKVLAEDPEGLLTGLVSAENVHWSKPYSGQSKAIERAFRDFASDIAKDVRLAGAYTGKDTVSKPSNYGSKAIPLERFREIVADGIARHNARPGRRGLDMDGRSCDEVFAACKDESGVFGKQLEAGELARWMLAMKSVTARAADGSVIAFGARYWSEELAAALAGRPKGQRQVVVRFDPERLDRPAVVERPDGRMIAVAEAQGRVPYFSAEAARRTAKARAGTRKAARAELDAALELDAAGLGALLDGCEQPEEAAPEAPNVFELEIPAGPEPDEAELEELIRQGEENDLALALGGG
ncbi:MAG: Mu transposase C-terminal domain-containing protein, partial [Rhodospirillaceae bacterium]|nr:Mu transposase C-terminal domain-containing protein [Rhodospirillaceae bacterium]